MTDVVKQLREKHAWFALIGTFTVGLTFGFTAHVGLQKWIFREQVCEEGKCIETAKVEAAYVSRSTYDAAAQQLAAREASLNAANQLVSTKNELIESLKSQLVATHAKTEVAKGVCANLLAQIKSLDDERQALQDRGGTSSLLVFGAPTEAEKISEANKRRLEQIQERLTRLADNYAACAPH